MRQVFEHDGIRFNVETAGVGFPLTMCHGLGGELTQCRELAGGPTRYRLILWDSRGHGLTEPTGPPEKFTFAQFASDLRALLAHLGVNNTILGGISMGAAVAARLACDCPDLVKALVLIRPAWLNSPMPENLRLHPVVADHLERYGSERGLAEFVKLPEVEALRSSSPYTFDSFCRQFRKPKAVDRLERLKRLPCDSPIADWGELEAYTGPALVFGNKEDPNHPIDYALEWSGRIPRAIFAQITSKSISPVEHEREFREHLARFMESLSI